ncbi:MAG: hypothetical protein ACRDYX_10875 [Egibacteraceae bacterium]
MGPRTYQDWYLAPLLLCAGLAAEGRALDPPLAWDMARPRALKR